MKKIGTILIGSLLLVSCTIPSIPISNFFTTPTSAPVFSPTPVLTATDTPTITPTQPTPTFTLTPTKIGEKTSTPTASRTSVPLTESPIVATATIATATPSVEMEGFNSVTLSASEFYIGNCEPSEVKFTAQVSKPEDVAHVDLFVRFKSITSGATSPWTSISMENLSAGTFTHTLVPEEMKAVDSFENPWVQYQLVATNRAIREVGRTQIFDELLRLKSCDLLTTTVTVTATP